MRWNKLIILTFSLIAVLAISCANEKKVKNLAENQPELAVEGYNLVWQDEFNTDELNHTRWMFDVKRAGSSELQQYTNSIKNAHVENGHLRIDAKLEGANAAQNSYQITSARLTTEQNAAWRYGRFEIRVKFPEGKAVWPAVYMLPEEETYGAWPQSGEIDIVEFLGDEPNIVYGTLHFGGKIPRNEQAGAFYMLMDKKFSDEFHVFRLDWEPEEIRWYVDDEHFLTQERWHSMGAGYDSFPAPFDKKFYMVLSLAIGRELNDVELSGDDFPKTMLVDYVRVYQKAGDPYSNRQLSLLK
jgi:beta-glucanase (GH16 family)